MPSTLPSDLSTSEMQTVYRGQAATFEATFLEKGQRVVPHDPDTFPSFAIYDPTGATVTTGIGTDLGAGKWRATWNVPTGAKAGDCKIIWVMVSNTQRTYTQTQRFTLREQNNSTEILEDPDSFVFWPQVGDRVTLLTEQPKYNMTLQMVMANGGSGLPIGTWTEQTTLLDGTSPDIKSETIGSQTLYWVDLPGYGLGEWLLMWSYRDYPNGPTQRKVKHLYVPSTLFWELHPAVADVLDRIQKNAKATPFGYYEDDLLKYMQMGFKMLNRFKPLTNWDVNDPTYPRAFDHFLIEASAFWACKSREIGSGELQFNYSGQEVTLDVDRSSVYATQTQAFADDINNYFKAEKINWYRSSYAPARLGLRLGMGVSAVLGGGDLLGGITSPYLRGFSRARRKGSW